MIPTTESRSCRSHDRKTGVCPDGAQVRRRTGWSMNPLSSKKTTGLPLRRAPFLCGANPVCAISLLRRRWLPVLASRASGMSSPSRGASFRRDPDDIALEKCFLSPRLLADRSKGPCDTRPFVVQPTEFRSVVVSAARRDGAFVRDVVWLSEPPGLLPPQPVATVSRNSAKHQHFPPLRRRSRPPRAASLPTSDELPVRMRFLSVS